MSALSPSGLIEFWFDFGSPYAFFAAQTIEEVARRHNRSVVWRPFMLGVLFKATGMQPLNQTPIRGDYARHDWERLARHHQVAFALPPHHPSATLPASRLFYWLEERDGAAAARFARRSFDAYFSEGIEQSTAEEAAAVAAEVTSFAPDELAAGAIDPAIKETLKQRTAEAQRRGIFGSPFFIVDGEPFWGADRLPMIEAWLTSGGW